LAIETKKPIPFFEEMGREFISNASLRPSGVKEGRAV